MGIVDDALTALDVDTLLLGVPDRSFPGAAGEDTGAGSPDSSAGRTFLGVVRALGFTGVQLGPQGETSAGNPSPYDGTLFSRGHLPLAVGRLGEEEYGHLLDPKSIERLVAGRPPGDPQRIAYGYAYRAHAAALASARAAFLSRLGAADPEVVRVAARLETFTRDAWTWLERDALYHALHDTNLGVPWTAWDAESRYLWRGVDRVRDRQELLARHGGAVNRHALTQLVLHEQHARMRANARALGLEIWGDLQIGLSAQDWWSHEGLFLMDYRLGAPPSRTNPEGQPWGYPVLDPTAAEAAVRFVAERLDKMFDEYDGVRIDHPHGLVCPWVYRSDTGDDGAALRAGARLFDAPALDDHPTLARLAIAHADQLNPDPRTARHADDWVIALEPAQVERYAWLVDAIVASARRYGRDARALACEVLSTCPYPLRRVLERHGLGRLRVTQKADLGDPQDVYRGENAAPEDWITIGTHDTLPIWGLAPTWSPEALRKRADYLAWRLAPDTRTRATLAARMLASPGLLVHAQFADLFASRARQVSVFFTDAFGFTETYNRPGTVGEHNWTLRLAPDYEARYRAKLRTDEALNLPMALALALGARGAGKTSGDRVTLVRRLEVEAEAWRRGELPAGLHT